MVSGGLYLASIHHFDYSSAFLTDHVGMAAIAQFVRVLDGIPALDFVSKATGH